MNLIVDDEFKNLIPPLSEEEFNQLEENILRDGIRDPLVIWNGILIDGHNRYYIAQKHNLPFETKELSFEDRAAAGEWIIQNQFGRRNISTFDRICLALKLKPVIAAQAKQNQLTTLKQNNLPFDQKKSNGVPVDTLKEIAKLAGVGKETVRKVEKILDISHSVQLDDIINGLRKGDISISLAYESAMYRKQNIISLSNDLLLHLNQARDSYLKAKEQYLIFLSEFYNLSPEQQRQYKENKIGFEKLLTLFEETLDFDKNS